jgi:diacylglycerol kinase family enzyme
VPGIGVINNPYSRKNKKNPEWLDGLGCIIGNQGTSAATKDVEDIHGMIRLFKEQEIDILAINGGDGSNSLVLTSLIEQYQDQKLPKIALLRGGTMNVVANSCGVKGTSVGLTIDLVEKYREGIPFETTWRDTLEIEGRYGFVFGNGFIYSFLEALYNTGKKSTWTASKLLTKGALSSVSKGSFAEDLFRPVRAKVKADGQELPQHTFSAITAGTVEQIGMNFKPFYRCEEQPKTFHMIGILCSPASFVAAMPKIYMGKKVDPKKVVEVVAHEVLLESDDPLSYTLDGENYSTGNTLKISTGPRLQIIVE